MASPVLDAVQAQGLKTPEASSPSTNEPQFALPVDSEHKAKTIRVLSIAKPHMRAFWLVTIAFFLTFFATFAPSALLPVIRENINADKWQLGSAGVASVCGAVVCRMFMGTMLDTFGPRLGTAGAVLLIAPAVFCMSMVTNPTGFLVVRLFIGCSLCVFVCCQFWVGSMFNVKIVGTANALSAGWGNMGGGACLLLMPLIYQGIAYHVPEFEAWRWAFFVPGGLYILIGLSSLMLGQDAPDGDYRDLKKNGQMAKKGQFLAVLKCGLGNYRTWILFLTYGYCFGVELTVDNIIAGYLYDQFEMDIVTAGAVGSVFGLMNIFTRATGGMLSDLAAHRFGMRGRLWVLYVIQTLGGVFCLTMGLVSYSEGASIAVMIIFSIFCQQACGATFGVVPLVSRRAYGVVSGMVGGGGNIGAIVTQTIFFAGNPNSPNLTIPDGLKWMGVMTIGMSLLIVGLHWPMWGSMFLKGNEEYAEEDYYLKEWTAEEVAQGLHGGSMKFAMESRSQRGFKAAAALNASLSGKAIGLTRAKTGTSEDSSESDKSAVMPPGRA